MSNVALDFLHWPQWWRCCQCGREIHSASWISWYICPNPKCVHEFCTWCGEVNSSLPRSNRWLNLPFELVAKICNNLTRLDLQNVRLLTHNFQNEASRILFKPLYMKWISRDFSSLGSTGSDILRVYVENIIHEDERFQESPVKYSPLIHTVPEWAGSAENWELMRCDANCFGGNIVIRVEAT